MRSKIQDSPPTLRRPKLLFFVTVDWFFCSHFMERALAAREAGYDVAVLTHVDQFGERMEGAGLRVIPIAIDRRSLNPFSALQTLRRIVKVYRRERPDVLHQIALKPILLGGLAARITGINTVVNAVVGGGYVFTSPHLLTRLLRPLIRFALGLVLNPKGSKVIFENHDDLHAHVESGQVRAGDAALIRGAGVDPAAFSIKGLDNQRTPLVIVPARLLWDKGIGEFVEAARLLRSSHVQARFALVGGTDDGNRASIPATILAAWREERVVELWGFRDDMKAVLAQADIVCLPSYREGLPKCLLEAMAAGLPCVTTDVPGCREAVRDGYNGILVPPRNPQVLKDALQRLIQDPMLRRKMGLRGRERVETEFSTQIVTTQTLLLYEELRSS